MRFVGDQNDRGGIYQFGGLVCFLFLFAVFVVTAFVCVLTPSTIIYYIAKVPSVEDVAEDSSDQSHQTAVIDDTEFDDW